MNRKIFEQRLIGLSLIVVAVVFTMVAVSYHNEDCGGGIVPAVVGLKLMFSKKLMIY